MFGAQRGEKLEATYLSATLELGSEVECATIPVGIR